MKKRIVDVTHRITCTFLALLLVLCGLVAEGVEEALAEFVDGSQAPAIGATASVDGEPCVSGQAIACVASGTRPLLEREYDSVELLLEIDAQSSNCGPCELVLVRSASQTIESLVAKLETTEGVVFAEPNYLEESQSDGVELRASALPTIASDNAARSDYTGRQYAFDGEFGIGVPDWNTYDGADNPAPQVNTAGKVVAVIDSGVDYNHEDLRNVMWSDGESYPTLVALGGGEHGINVAMPRGDGAPYDTADPMDDMGHGTHVAGIIAGEWNGFGVSGATSGARVMAVKVSNDIDMMSVNEAIRGYQYVIEAQKAGVNVVAINNSWNDDTYSKSLDMAMREAGRMGAVSVFAAGNDRSDIDMIGQVHNAFLSNPYAVVVGNSNESGLVSETSNYGRRSVDVFAPGEEICSTILTGMGPGDYAADPLVATDVTYACDYESVDVRNNADNGVFGFEGAENTALAIADEGHASSHSLSLTGAMEETLAVTMNSKALAAGSECHGLCMWVKAPAAKKMSCMLINKFADGNTQMRNVNLSQGGDDWQVLAFPIERGANKDGLELLLTMQVLEWRGSPDPTILIDDVKLTSATIPYDYNTGTSMAAPAVTGGATVLAAAFPEDDAARRAARVVGSVKPVDDAADLCVSDGIFRLDKALEQDTNPVLNGASTQAGAVTVEGYFFGDVPGSISADGQALTVVSWSDTQIVAQLPGGFPPGEKLVQVTTEAGRSGHQFLRIGTPASLYQRLPLPGRTLSGNPGDYAVTSSEFDESFYGRMPHALVGLGGKLYYLMGTDDGRCSIFCYDIDGQAWTQVYEGGYTPTGGACTWNGKILFVAGQLQENSTYFGLFDPSTNTVEYHLYNDQCYERRSTLVNTGKGILLAGGLALRYGENREPDIGELRVVDPESFAVSTVALPDDVNLAGEWYASAYDEEENGYLFCGASLTGFYKFSFVDGNVTCTVLTEGSLVGEEDGEASSGISASADGSVSDLQNKRMVAGPTKSGIIASGPAMTDETGVVTADTYTVNWGDTLFEATSKQMGVTKIHNIAGTTYRGRFYVIGASESEVGGWVFASELVETLEQPGDVSDSQYLVRPGDPSGQAQPGAGAEQPGVDSGQPSNPSDSLSSTTRQATAASKLPNTDDPLPLPVALLALLCLVLGGLLRTRRAPVRTGKDFHGPHRAQKSPAVTCET